MTWLHRTCLCDPKFLSMTSFFFFFNICLLAVVGLHHLTRAFSSCSEQALHLVAELWLHIVVASLVAKHGL